MNWFRRFMAGRNGIDQLSNFMVVLSIILLIVSRIFNLRIMYLISIVNIIFAYIRIFSKNTNKRYRENNKFLNLVRPITNKIRSFFNRVKGLKDYKYFKCSNCNQRVRVPRGKGKIKITCPKCKNKMTRRT